MRKLRLFFIIILGCVMLVGCSSKKLSDDFNEEELKTTTEDVIQMLCNEEYDKIKEMNAYDAHIIQNVKNTGIMKETIFIITYDHDTI